MTVLQHLTIIMDEVKEDCEEEIRQSLKLLSTIQYYHHCFTYNAILPTILLLFECFKGVGAESYYSWRRMG